MSGRSRTGARPWRRGSRRRGRRRAGPPRAGSRPTRRTGGAGGRRGPSRYASIARESAAAARSASASACGSCAARVPSARSALKNVRYGDCVGCGNRRSNGLSRIDGAALRDRESVAPEPERKAEPEVGGEHRVRPLAGQVRRRRRDPDDGDVQRLLEARRTAPRRSRSSASTCATDGGPPKTASRGQLARDRAEQARPDRPGSKPEREPDRATPRSARTPDRRAGSRGRRR